MNSMSRILLLISLIFNQNLLAIVEVADENTGEPTGYQWERKYSSRPKLPENGGQSTHKPKNCLCEGGKHDGPLKGLCVIKCTCPGNCGN